MKTFSFANNLFIGITLKFKSVFLEKIKSCLNRSSPKSFDAKPND